MLALTFPGISIRMFVLWAEIIPITGLDLNGTGWRWWMVLTKYGREGWALARGAVFEIENDLECLETTALNWGGRRRIEEREFMESDAHLQILWSFSLLCSPVSEPFRFLVINDSNCPHFNCLLTVILSDRSVSWWFISNTISQLTIDG